MQFIKKNSACFIAPLFVLAVLSVVFFSYGLYPFGPLALYNGDMAQQNLPVLIEFKDIMLGKQGPFFSMVNAGGMNFLGMFLFLASSPFSFLAVLIDKVDLVYFINIMIALKLVTAAVTSAIFFRHFFKGLKSMQTVALSVSYALCGYSMLFYQLHTWLDVMYMFPLLIIAFETLLKKGKIAPYSIVLSLMILFQFYLGYMLALFIIFAFALYTLMLSEAFDRKRNVVIFAKGTLTAVLITAPVWMSAFSQYENSARKVSIISSLSSGSFISEYPTTLSFILATALIVAIIPFVKKMKLFSDKTLRPVIIMFAMLFVPIIIEPVNKMWHTGSYQAFPVRYGYMTVLVGLSLVAAVLTRLNEKNGGKHKPRGYVTAIVLASFAVLGAVGVWLLSTKEYYLNDYINILHGSKTFLLFIAIFSIIAAGILWLLFRLYGKNLLSVKSFTFFLCIMVAAQGVFNCSVYMGLGAREVVKYKQVADLEGKITDTDLYRVKVRRKYFDVNLVGAFGYNSLAHYTSLISDDYMSAMKKLGYTSYWMEVNTCGSTMFTDAFLGNKYTIAKYYNAPNPDGIVYENDVYSILRNRYNMSLGNVVSKETADRLAVIPEKNRIAFQQELFEAVTGSDKRLVTEYDYSDLIGVKIKQDDEKIKYSLDNPKEYGFINYKVHVNGRQRLYFDCYNSELAVKDSCNIIVNGLTLQTKYPNDFMNGMFDLGEYEDETVTVTISVLKKGTADSFGVFGIDLDALSDGMSRVNPAAVKCDGDVITAQAQAENDGEMLMLTVPYNDGFTITVNGKEVKAEKTLDAFMAIPLEKGANSVELKFSPKGLKTGLIICFAGIILLLAFSIISRFKKYIRIKWLENTLYWGFLGSAALALFMVYVFPVLVYFFFLIA